jgi:hypothetical protein
VNYREKLGIGFTDIEKLKLLQTKIINFLNVAEEVHNLNKRYIIDNSNVLTSWGILRW